MNQPKVIRVKDRFNQLPALKCAVFYNDYGGYCVPASSHQRPAAQTIMSNGIWEPKTLNFMRANCKDGDIVHAGTYFGDFLPALSKGIASKAKVWAFEPNIENYRCARITRELNNLTNVKLSHAGLGEKEETLYLQTTDANGNSLGGASKIVDSSSGTDLVEILSIDGKVGKKRNISIIQLDVEGHEEAALKGAIKTIQRCLPIIILEIWPNSTLLSDQWFTENILSLGYKKTQNIHDNVVYSCD